MAEKHISIKGLADYMTASATRQRKILREFKYPSEEEAKAKILYYRDARTRIQKFHKKQYDVEWLLDQAEHIKNQARLSSGRRKSRLQYNAKGLRQYAKHFGKRDFLVLPDESLDLQYDDVVITIHPDLYVKEKKKDKIIKLEFTKDKPRPQAVKIIVQCLFEAANDHGLGLTSASVLYFDVIRGVEYRGARMGSRMASDIEATCENISGIWDTI